MFRRNKKQFEEQAVEPSLTPVKGSGKKEENIYIENRREADDRYMNLAVSRQNWIRAFQIVCALLAVSIGFNGYYSLQSKFIPYFIAYDKLGHIVQVGVVDKSNPIDSKRIIRNSMMEWIENSRAVISDKMEMKRKIDQVYSHVGSNSKVKKQLDAYYKERQVFDLAARQTIAAEITLAIPRGGNTWEIEWNEIRISPSGEKLGAPERWKAIVTYDFVPLDTEAAIRANPTGIFVTEFSWTKQI